MWRSFQQQDEPTMNTVPQSPPLRDSASSSVHVRTQAREAGPGVSWAAVIAGALAAAALSLILLALGSGLGFAAVSPWTQSGASAAALGVGSIVWLMVMAAVSSALGGYLAGRLRTKWTDVHSDEVYFRDTAHGFLAWALATLLTAALLTSAAASLVGGAARVGAAAATAGATAIAGAGAGAAAANALSPNDAAGTQGSGMQATNAYFVDSLFRSDRPATQDSAPSRAEAGRIMLMSLGRGELNPTDKAYLTQLVAANTGMSAADAERRVTATYDRAARMKLDAETAAKEAADTARKAAASLALWVFVSLLLGAFLGSLAATIGGRQRDWVVAP
jgi:hypothetical protein